MHFLPSLLLLGVAHATTTIHYYRVASCNTGTDIGSYDMPLNDTATDTACHAATSTTTTSGVKALYINGLDDGCALIAYTDALCDPSSASPKLGEKGDCFYLDNFATIAAWRAVCGQSLAAASSSLGVGGGAKSTASSTSSSASATESASATGSATKASSTSAANRKEFVGLGGAVVVGAAVVGGSLFGGLF